MGRRAIAAADHRFRVVCTQVDIGFIGGFRAVMDIHGFVLSQTLRTRYDGGPG